MQREIDYASRAFPNCILFNIQQSREVVEMFVNTVKERRSSRKDFVVRVVGHEPAILVTKLTCILLLLCVKIAMRNANLWVHTKVD